MKQKFIKHNGGRRLLLFFAGWGMDATPFCMFRADEEEDVMVCYDYRSDSFRTEGLGGYEELRIVAWSMGVWMSHRVWLRHASLLPPLAGAVALCGTLFPIDAVRGIAPRVYRLTVRGMREERNVVEFYRRMCGDETEYEHFLANRPRRPVEELREELEAIEAMIQQPCREAEAGCEPLLWSRAYVGGQDRIFPPQAQRVAWQGVALVEGLPCGHWPFSAARFCNAAGVTEWNRLGGEG